MNPQRNINLISIIRQAKKGTQKAQSLLMRIFWNDVYHYVLKKIHDDDEAEDIAIETFTKVLNKLKLYNENFNFHTWLITIAHNTMLDHFRQQKIQNISLDQFSVHTDFLSSLILEEHSPEEKLISKQTVKQIRDSIERLPLKYKKVVRLRFLEEKTYKEISKELFISMNQVKIQLLRAKKLLLKILRPA
ncbi:MAG: RNA polymerase sigma factor [Flavobacteriales bacterium AspAUS03]